MMKHPVVAVALSGGVDSLVSGWILKQRYKHVFGIHFKTGYEKAPINPALLEAALGFPVTEIDLSDNFEKTVVEYLVQTYLEGKTPNPCLICNKEIKFGALLKHAQKLGADYLATGHYATIVNPVSFPDSVISQSYLEKGTDPQKDQSYFLSLLSGHQLEKIIFPLAGMIKADVKQLARSNGISPIHPSESQDICFIQDTSVSRFILDKKRIVSKPGHVTDLNGNIIGSHTGLHQFTIGQRRGINIPASDPYYVKRIDIPNNLLEVCFKKDLSTRRFTVGQINWNYPEPDPIHPIMTKIRYSHKGARSTIIRNQDMAEVVFDEPQNAVTPGQAAVFYKNRRVLGAGIIQ
jgi:tRNA-specific 2-thiouridylase